MTSVDESSYRLAELAELSGVSERTIRYYQAEHLLPRPIKLGREVMYGVAHRERLVLIAELRERGLTLQTIGELLTSKHPTRTVSEWLGVDATLRAPWSDDRPTMLTSDNLIAMIESNGADSVQVLDELIRSSYIVANLDETYSVPSPALLDGALRLHHAGIAIDVSARMRDLLRRRLSKAVDDTVELIVDRVGTGFGGGASPEELAVAVAALRPVAREMSSVIIAHEVERALAELVQSGPKSLRRARRH